MLPVTRANLDNICCTCLVNICQSKDTKQKAYDVKKETNLFKMLKLTAYMDVLKNPLNLKCVNDYCRKVCDICFLNVKKAFQFREKLLASTKKIKGLLERKLSTNTLKNCCRICLNLQHFVGKDDKIYNTYLKWIEDFSGMDEITNELVLKYDGLLPKQLCQSCLAELQNIEELQILSKYSFEHMVSEISKNDNLLQVHSNLSEIEASEKEFFPSQNNVENDDKIKSNYDPNEVIMLKSEDVDTQYQEIYNNVNLQTNMALKDSQNENNIDVTNALVNENDYSDEGTMVSEIIKNDNVLHTLPNSSKDKTNKQEFIPQKDSKNDDKAVPIYDPNDEIILKCEEEDTQYQEIIYDNVNLQTNIDLKESQNEKNNTDATIILLSETDDSNESTTNFEKDNDDDFTLTDIAESSMTDSNATDEDTKKYKKRNKKIKQKISGEHKVQKPPEKNNENAQEMTEAEKLANTCPICSKYFKYKRHVQRHIATVHERQKPFKCSYCPRMFPCSSSKKRHEFTHTGKFPFVCKLCQKGFYRRDFLRDHIRRHTTKPGLTCSICKKVQGTKEELKNHLKTHKKQSFPCPSCDKIYYKRYSLDEHQISVHLKLEPFKCKFCDKSFSTTSRKYCHEKTHTEDNT